MRIDSVSFGQKFIRPAQIRNNKTNTKEDVHFVEYEYSFYDLSRIADTAKKWNMDPKNNYSRRIFKDYIDCYLNGSKTKRFFGLEDKNQNILAMLEANTGLDELNLEDEINSPEKSVEITYFCTDPKTAHGAKDRKYSKTGTVLLSEMIKHSKTIGADSIALFNGNRQFWDTIPCFRSYGSDCVKILEADKFDTCIRELDKKE